MLSKQKAVEFKSLYKKTKRKMANEADIRFVRQLSGAATDSDLQALLIGGHAVNMHGVSRFTEDFDFLVPREKLPAWKDLLATFHFAMFREGPSFAQFAREVEQGPKRLDLMLVNDETFAKLSVRAVPLPEPSENLRIVSVEHLLALKLHVLKQDLDHRRLRDFLDVVDLVKANQIDLQSAEMQEIFKRYGTPELFHKVKFYCE
jgi:predicted nucleotidyltransferase component of viral defense system